MRYLSIIALLFALALPAGAADLRPATITVDDATTLPRLKGYIKALNRSTCKQASLPKNCTDAEAKAINPQLKVYATSNAGIEDYWRDNLVTLSAAMVLSDTARQAEQDLVEAWRLGTPAQRAAALAALPALP